MAQIPYIVALYMSRIVLSLFIYRLIILQTNFYTDLISAVFVSQLRWNQIRLIPSFEPPLYQHFTLDCRTSTQDFLPYHCSVTVEATMTEKHLTEITIQLVLMLTYPLVHKSTHVSQLRQVHLHAFEF